MDSMLKPPIAPVPAPNGAFLDCDCRMLIIPDRWVVTEAQFTELAHLNRDLRLERTAQGELIIMPPTGGETGRKNVRLIVQAARWNDQHLLGEVFDSSTGFRLPTGAIRSPDVSWVRADRWAALTEEDRSGFVPLCPDWAIELRSRSDRRETLEAKMQEYLAAGLQLGWLIDPQQVQVGIYQPDRAPVWLDRPATLSGDPLLPGLVLDLREVWPPSASGS